MKRFWIPIALVLACALVSPAVAGAGKGPKARDPHKAEQHKQEKTRERIFNQVERAIICSYFGCDAEEVARPKKATKAKALPPGLAKRDALPPGLAKRDQLPPGLAKRDIPPELAARLGIPPQGTERVLVGGDLVLLETATGVILDVLHGVL